MRLDDFAPRLLETLKVRSFSLLRIPLLFFCSPSVVELTDQRCVISIPHRRRTSNHLGSMYFGALCIGADTAGGLIAMRRIQAAGNRVSLIFKDFRAEFLKRAEGETHFTCSDGDAIRECVDRALSSGERENIPVHVVATVPSKLGEEPVAQFTLTLSLKRR